MRIIATAGHVDHGKSTLVESLTGIHPDRWDEERRRGLTIDLGFAHTTLDAGEGVSFIDVPGHIRFISNMLAGVGGIHGCLFVVDVREGWMPQTEEHLRILQFIGVEHGIIALTKVDGVDSDTRDLVALDIAERTHGTFLANAPIVGVSAITGEGMNSLRAALQDVVTECPASRDRHVPRLFIDRVFAAKGSGTVVTGTLTDGRLSVGDQVIVTPNDRPARIRGIQSLGRPHESIGPGHRVALNLSGIDHHELTRGNVVVHPDTWFTTSTVDARLDVLPRLDHGVSRRGAFTVHVGSDEVPTVLRVLGREQIAPGTSGFVRLRLAHTVPLLPGDRFVIRESGRSETVGGGEILDIDPVLGPSRARPDRSVDRVIAERGVVTHQDLLRLTGVDVSPTTGDWVLSPTELERRRTSIRACIDSAGADGADIASFDAIDRSLIAGTFEYHAVDGRVRLIGRQDPLLQHRALSELEAQRCAPAARTDLSTSELRRLEKAGLVFESQGVWFHSCALDDARIAARRLLEEHPDGFTVSQFREALGITRKHAVPLAAALDSRGITRRRGDMRIGGPRLSSEG